MKSLLRFFTSAFFCTIFLTGCSGQAPSIATDRIAPVMLDGKCGYIDETGTIVIKPQFENCSSFCTNGLASACRDGKYGYIDTSGAFVIEPQFDFASIFSNEIGRAHV